MEGFDALLAAGAEYVDQKTAFDSQRLPSSNAERLRTFSTALTPCTLDG
jgi:hypothetical protein